jgi:hypothetical protein
LVVTAVRSSKALQHSNFFVSKQPQSPMDIHIMDDEVCKAIGSDADAGWYKCAK